MFDSWDLLWIIFLVLCVIVVIPSFLTLVVGIGFANLLGFVGLTWWCFVGLFYLIVMAVLAYLYKRRMY